VNVDDLFEDTSSQARRARPDHPNGWAPGLEWDEATGTGTVTSPPTDGQPDWAGLLDRFLPVGFDRSLMEVDPESVRFTAWDGWQRDNADGVAVSAVQYSFRARLRPAGSVAGATFDLSDAVKRVRRAKGRASKTVGAGTLVVQASDWQIGKPKQAGGDGSAWRETVDRWNTAIHRVEDQWKAVGKPGRIVLAGTGDLVEGCKGHYSQQTFRAELNDRDQDRVVFEMLDYAITRLSKLAAEVWVVPVGGNHGENRDAGGKSFTDFADNRDVSVFGFLQAAFAKNVEAFGHVRFMVPRHDLTQTIDLDGTIVGLVHGHQFGGGGSVQTRAEKWWQGQMAGRWPVGDADILLFGHYHHLIVAEALGSRTVLCGPALDDGSDWWAQSRGGNPRSGVLSFTVGDSGWDHLRVL